MRAGLAGRNAPAEVGEDVSGRGKSCIEYVGGIPERKRVQIVLASDQRGPANERVSPEVPWGVRVIPVRALIEEESRIGWGARVPGDRHVCSGEQEALRSQRVARFRIVIDKCNRGRKRPFGAGEVVVQVEQGIEDESIPRGGLQLLVTADVDDGAFARVVHLESEVKEVPTVDTTWWNVDAGATGEIGPGHEQSSDPRTIIAATRSVDSKAGDETALGDEVVVADLRKRAGNLLVDDAIGAGSAHRQVVRIGAVASVEIGADRILGDRSSEEEIGVGADRGHRGASGVASLVVFDRAAFGHQPRPAVVEED